MSILTHRHLIWAIICNGEGHLKCKQLLSTLITFYLETHGGQNFNNCLKVYLFIAIEN